MSVLAQRDLKKSGMDKAELVNRLKIDRGETASSGRPLKWFIAIAMVAGAAIASYSLGLLDSFAPTAAAGPLPVETVLAQVESRSSPGDSVLDATGYVVARRQATVSSKVTAKVIDVLVEEGMVVERGQLLAVLDDSIPQARLSLAQSQLDAAKAALAELQVNLRQARLDLSRTENLAERSLASQADLDRDSLSVEGLMARLSRTARDIAVSERSLALQRQELTDMEIRAPFGGVVIAKAAQPGEMISPVSAGGGFTRTGICTIVDMDSLEVEVDVNEAYINRVYPDQPVTVALNAYPDDDFPASVIATIPAADRNKATVRVRIRFLERDARVLPDMGVRVSFLERSQEERSQTTGEAAAQAETLPGVLVPASAVSGADGARFVWVVENQTAQRRDVVVADSVGSRVRIADGLAGGERVVARLDAEQGALANGVRVTVVN